MTRKATAPAAERTRTSADVQADIVRLKAEKGAAETEMARLRAARPAILADLSPDGDAKLDAHDAEQAKAYRVIERRAVLLVGAEAELAELLAVEKQATLREAYAAGEAAAAEYRRLVESEYGPTAIKLSKALEAMAKQLAIVDQANERRPDGEMPIDADDFRHVTPERGPKPPRTVEALRWVDARGNPCSSNAPGAVMKYETKDNPFYASWLEPREKITAPSIVAEARLPGADHDMLFGERNVRRW